MTILVQKARPEHAGPIADFQKKLALETERYVLDDQTVHDGVAAVFNDPAKGVYYIASINETAVACLLTVPEWSDWRNGTVLWIHSLYVAPEYRNKGVFREMYKTLKGMVEADDSLKGLRLYVDLRNRNAIEVYTAMGMTCEHYRMFEWMKG